MRNKIRYSGLSLHKDDELVEAGELSLCGGVEIHHGSLRPSLLNGTTPPHALSHDGVVYTLLYVHETNGYKHFIGGLIEEDGDSVSLSLAWFEEDGQYGGDGEIHRFTFDSALSVSDIKIESVGNTMVLLLPDGLHYILWKTDVEEDAYVYMGQQPPYVPIRFTLSANGTSSGIHWRNTEVNASDALSVNGKTVNIGSDYRTAVTEAVWALINKTNSELSEKGYFTAPFFIRYCYRMYDGTTYMHSAPILMHVAMPNCYKVRLNNARINNGGDVELITSGAYPTVDLTYEAVAVKPKYHITGLEAVERLASLQKDWSDVIKSIDFFVSQPVVREESGKQIAGALIEDYQYGDRDGTYTSYYCYDDNDAGIKHVVMDIPSLDDEKYAERICNTSTFFKLCSIDLSALTGNANGISSYVLPYDDATLNTLVTQELMKDEYKSHHQLIPSGKSGCGLYVYNHRVNVYGLSEHLFEGFDMMNMTDACYNTHGANKTLYIKEIIVGLDTTSGMRYVKKELDVSKMRNWTIPERLFCNTLWYYPDSRARKIAFLLSRTYGGPYSYLVLSMTPHNELNGSIVKELLLHNEFSGVKDLTENFDYTLDNTVPLLNKLYTSESDNPYYFPVNAINTIGTGEIKGIASTTRALSQGQFGQYPLMVFCTDGVWAMDVSSTGTYSGVHPISREVVSNSQSICPCDQSVVFATNRAMNKIIESSVSSFSDVLQGPLFDINLLPQLVSFFSPQGRYADRNVRNLLSSVEHPLELFQTGKVLYDFANSRLLFFSVSDKDSVVVYVYQLYDNSWSTLVVESPLNVVNSYPYPYIQWVDGRVMRLDKRYDYASSEDYSGIIVTRTLNFGGMRKAITAFSHQFDCEKSPVLFIWGSNDDRCWHYIGRSSKSFDHYLPCRTYRYFRIGLYLKMSPCEKYFSTDVEVVEKFGKL